MVRRSVEGAAVAELHGRDFSAQSGAPLTDGEKGLTTSTADGAFMERRGCNQRQSATNHPAPETAGQCPQMGKPCQSQGFPLAGL
jgi:hypothetical protein